MEQLGLYVILLCGVTMIVSLVTLHRMRKISKQLRELAGNQERMLAQLTSRFEGSPDEPPQGQPAEVYKPEELIDAVLGEVFS